MKYLTCETCEDFDPRYNSSAEGYCYSDKMLSREAEIDEEVSDSLFYFAEEGCGVCCIRVGIDFGCIHHSLMRVK